MPGETITPATATTQKMLLGRTMRQCRERAGREGEGLSRDRLAPKAFITSSTLEKWESGERLPTLQKLTSWFDAVDANDWYREKIISLTQPDLFEMQMELTAPERRTEPTEAELRQLETFPYPACYRRLPTYDLIAANSAFRRTFPGLAPAPPTAARPTNFVEWLILAPAAKTIITDWRRHTHVLVNALQILSPGVVPDAYVDAIVASCSRTGEFLPMWTTDVTNRDIHNTDLTVLDPTRGEHIDYSMMNYRVAAARGHWEMVLLNPRT